MENDVYLEFASGDSAYLSFSKTKKLLSIQKPSHLSYVCCDSKRSNHFFNELLSRYKIEKDMLVLRTWTLSQKKHYNAIKTK